MKTAAKFILLFVCASLLYTTTMYGYVWMKMRPVTPIAPASAVASASVRPQVLMLHRVNTVRRATAKAPRYEGFELDLNRVNGSLRVTHDAGKTENAATLGDIFSSVSNPGQKTWWIDLKTELTQNDIDDIKSAAARYGINPRRLLFETSAGPTALLLQKNGLPLILSVPDGFDRDGGDPQKRAALNARLEEQIRTYHPYAVAASFGKYPYLKAYFPNYNKAVYSSTTVRPSLKKKFLAEAMLRDPKVQIWMQDEYTALPF